MKSVIKVALFWGRGDKVLVTFVAWWQILSAYGGASCIGGYQRSTTVVAEAIVMHIRRDQSADTVAEVQLNTIISKAHFFRRAEGSEAVSKKLGRLIMVQSYSQCLAHG